MDTVIQMIDVRVHFNIMEEIENVGEEICMVSFCLFYTPLINVRVTSLGVNSGEGHVENVKYEVVELTFKHVI